ASWRPTLGLSKVRNWIQDALIGYGYAPWRAFAWLLAILISGTLIFYFWIQPQPLQQGAKFTLPNAFLYTLDLLLPVFKLGEKSNWHTGQAGTVVGVLVAVTGWIFGATVVAAVTRVLKRR